MLLKIFIIFLGFGLSACRRVPFFRKDYTYVGEFDAFYKLHYDISGKSWSTAFFGCEKEDAQLFYPKAPEEWKLVNNLLEAKGLDITNFSSIYVGIKNEGIEEFLTVDGLPTPSPLVTHGNFTKSELCTTMDLENGSLNIDVCDSLDGIPKPYVCKKIEDISCPTIDKGYHYVKETKKCYKVNKMSQSWHEALNTCVMQGGLLVNIESEMEANIILQLISTDTLYHVGFRQIFPSGEYYNLKGQNIKDTYEKYYNRNENLECGSVWIYGTLLYLNTMACTEVKPSVCEMEVTK